LEGRTPRSGLLALLAGLLLAGAAGGLTAQLNLDLTAFVIVALIQGAVWVIAAAVVLRRRDRRCSLALILGTAVLLRFIALAAPVFLSDDINRYIWDGRVQAAGVNPYHYVPTDPELEPLRDLVIFPNINRNNYAPTIYPPVAQMLFLMANRFGQTPLVVKLMFVTIEALGIGSLMFILRAAGRPLDHILLYVWHPLPVWEIAGSGHVDAAVVTFAAVALAAAVSGRHLWSAIGLAAATLVKFFPLVLAPALWRPTRSSLGDWRWPAVFIGVIVAAYLPYIGVGTRAVGFLPGYIGEENLSAGDGFWLLAVARRVAPVPLIAYISLAASVMSGLAIGAFCRPPDPSKSLLWATALGTAAMFFTSPHYPWYFVWLVGLLTAAPWWPAWWLTVTAVLLYSHARAGDIPLWVGFTVYGGFIILCVVDLVRRTVFNRTSGARRAVDCAT
jgi:alpha-1,6-mannosyltransferase